MIESFKLPTITPETLTGSICSFTDEYGGLPLKSCTSLITGYQEGSGTPSPDNVRPLHAWSEANLTATGKNLFDKSNNMGRYLDGSLTIRTNAEFKSVYVELTPNTTYTYSQTESGNYKRYALANSLEEYAEFVNPVDHSSHLYLSETPFTFNSGDYKYLICTIYRVSDTKTFDEIANSCQLEIGQEATTYEPFGNSYIFTFGQDIYSGSIDWEKGVVRALWGYFTDNGTRLWVRETGLSAENNYYTFYVIDNAKFVSGVYCNLQKSEEPFRYTGNPNSWISSSGRFNITLENEMTIEEFLDWLNANPIQVAYELAEPIEIPLGGINLLTQEGLNNIFCNTGDTEVKFLKVT